MHYLKGLLQTDTVNWSTYTLQSRFGSDRISVGFPVDLPSAEGFKAEWTPNEMQALGYGAYGSDWGLNTTLKFSGLVEADETPGDVDDLTFAGSQILSVSF